MPAARVLGRRGSGVRRQRALRLRRATAADWLVLVDHRHRMWSDIGGRTPRQLVAHDRLYERWLRPRLKTGEAAAFLVELPDGRVVASGGIWFRPEQPRPEAPRSRIPYVFSMYTEPGFRRRGLGGRIVQEAIRIARSRGYPRIVLHAAPEGRALYLGLGFERGWEMRLDLRR